MYRHEFFDSLMQDSLPNEHAEWVRTARHQACALFFAPLYSADDDESSSFESRIGREVERWESIADAHPVEKDERADVIAIELRRVRDEYWQWMEVSSA